MRGETVAEDRVGRQLGPADSPRAWDPFVPNGIALLLLAPLLVLLVVFVIYPLLRLAWVSLTAGDGPGNYVRVLSSEAGRRAVLTTLISAVVVTLVSVPAGALLAWYITTAERRWVRTLLLLSVLVPFWMGTVVKNYAIILLVSRNGALNKLLGLFGVGPVELLYTPIAVTIGMIYTMVPYAVFSLYGVFRTMDLSLLAAARSIGASRFEAIRSVLLPLAAPGLAASSALVFAISLGFYVTPVLLGGAQAPFMAGLIRDFVFSYFDYPFASAAAVILLAVAVATLGIALRVVGLARLLGALR